MFNNNFYKEIKKTIHMTKASNNKILRNRFNKKRVRLTH